MLPSTLASACPKTTSKGRRAAAVLGGAALALPVAGAALPAQAATSGPTTTPNTVDVSAAARGGLQAAISAAKPGTTIRLHRGTYSGQLRITRSGTRSAPITLTSAGDGPVTITSSLRWPSCHASSPAQDRTIEFSGGADYWNIQGLNIYGGIIAVGTGSQEVLNWNRRLIFKGDWATRRAIPGRGSDSPSASGAAIAAMASRVGRHLDPSDGIKITGNTLTGMGIQMSMSRYGTVINNQIHDIKCGTGPGVWLGNFSDGWTVSGNHIWNIAAGTYKHYMYEGVRLGNAADYNTVTHNLVENIPADGRAFTTDEDASWNTFSYNTARGVNIGFNDQMSGWGNLWTHNVLAGYRGSGYVFRALDAHLRSPSKNSSTYRATVTCNVATGGPTGMYAGGIMDSSFSGNNFGSVKLPATVRSYWVPQDNRWNGARTLPPDHPSAARC